MESAIDRFYAALPDQKRALTLYLRDIITEVHPKIVERIKWGNLTFVNNGTTSLPSTVSKPYPILTWLFLRLRR